MINRTSYTQDSVDNLREKYQDIIDLWETKKFPVTKIASILNQNRNKINATVCRLRMHGLVTDHPRGRPKSKPNNITDASYYLSRYKAFRGDSTLTQAAGKRGIAVTELIRRMMFECIKCPSLIDNILDDGV